jgi:hypothetical protein
LKLGSGIGVSRSVRAWTPRPFRAIIFGRIEHSTPRIMPTIPGGYTFSHLIFWTVVSLVAVGTNAMAIILSFGLGILALESIKGD